MKLQSSVCDCKEVICQSAQSSKLFIVQAKIHGSYMALIEFMHSKNFLCLVELYPVPMSRCPIVIC